MSDQSTLTLEEALLRFEENIKRKPLTAKKTIVKVTNRALLEAKRDFIESALADGACPEDLAKRISEATSRNYTAESLEKNLRDLTLRAEEKQRTNVKREAEIARQQKAIKATPVMPDVPVVAEPAGTEVQPIAPPIKKSASEQREAFNDDTKETDPSRLFGSTPEGLS
jgi:hypothetical protein